METVLNLNNLFSRVNAHITYFAVSRVCNINYSFRSSGLIRFCIENFLVVDVAFALNFSFLIYIYISYIQIRDMIQPTILFLFIFHFSSILIQSKTQSTRLLPFAFSPFLHTAILFRFFFMCPHCNGSTKLS